MRDKWTKAILVVLVAIVTVQGFLLWTYLKPKPVAEVTKVGNSYDFREIGGIGVVIANVMWIDKPVANATVRIQTKELQTMYTTKTDEGGIAEIDLSNFDNQTYYLTITYTAHFLEGGAETRYLYVIFICNTASSDTLTANVKFAPEIWEEEPTIKI